MTWQKVSRDFQFNCKQRCGFTLSTVASSRCSGTRCPPEARRMSVSPLNKTHCICGPGMLSAQPSSGSVGGLVKAQSQSPKPRTFWFSPAEDESCQWAPRWCSGCAGRTTPWESDSVASVSSKRMCTWIVRSVTSQLDWDCAASSSRPLQVPPL